MAITIPPKSKRSLKKIRWSFSYNYNALSFLPMFIRKFMIILLSIGEWSYNYKKASKKKSIGGYR